MVSNVTLNILSFVFLVMAGGAYVLQKRTCLIILATIFFPVATTSLLTTWWPLQPILAIVFIFVTLGGSFLALTLFVIDYIWAPFALEMTYVTFLCWVLCPLAWLLDLIGVIIANSTGKGALSILP